MSAKKRLTIGDFSIGKIGTKYFVYRDQWIKHLSISDSDKKNSFQDVIDEAYKEASDHCKELRIPAPPYPKVEL